MLEGFQLSHLDSTFKSSVVTFTRLENRYYFTLANNSFMVLGMEHCRPTCFGLLGLGTNVTRALQPTEVGVLHGMKVIKLCGAGGSFVLALTASGQIWSWGSNAEGQLGVGASVEESGEPMLVPLDDFVIDICCSTGYALALSQTGRLWTWGGNREGRLGLEADRWPRYLLERLIRPLNEKLSVAIPEDVVYLTRYQPVQLAGLDEISSIVCSHGVSYALRYESNNESTLYFWGSGTTLVQNANATFRVKKVRRTTPTRLPMPKGVVAIKAIAANALNAFVLSKDGRIWMLLFNEAVPLFESDQLRFDVIYGNDWHSFLVGEASEDLDANHSHVYVWPNIRYMQYSSEDNNNLAPVVFEDMSNVPKAFELPFLSDAFATLRVCSLPFMIYNQPDKLRA